MTHVPNLPRPAVVGFLLAHECICLDCVRAGDTIAEPIYENAPDECECERCGAIFATVPEVEPEFDGTEPRFAHQYSSVPLPGQYRED